MTQSPLPRRRFLRHALAAMAVSCGAPTLVSARVLGADDKAPANSRINVGLIGTGRQAYHANLLPFLASAETQVVALCDVDAWRLERTLKKVDASSGVRYRSGPTGLDAGTRLQ